MLALFISKKVCFAPFDLAEGDMPSIAATPHPLLQTMRSSRDEGVRTGVGRSTGESSSCYICIGVRMQSYIEQVYGLKITGTYFNSCDTLSWQIYLKEIFLELLVVTTCLLVF